VELVERKVLENVAGVDSLATLVGNWKSFYDVAVSGILRKALPVLCVKVAQ
jgi:hypothetical protein